MARQNSGALIGRVILDEVLCREGSLCSQNKGKTMPSNRSTKPVPSSKAKSASRAKSKSTPSKTSKQGSSSKRGYRSQGMDKLDNPIRGSDVATTATSKFVTTADVSVDATTVVDTNYPQVADLFHYAVRFYPTGTGSTIARSEFENTYGLKMLVDMKNALSYGAVSPLTVAEVADYINTVAASYMILLSVKHHFALCYGATRRASLRSRFNYIYDESIQPVFRKLAGALDDYFLPAGVARIVEHLAKPSLVAPTSGCSYIQLTPWDSGNDDPSDFAAILQSALSNLASIANREIINTALSSSRYKASSVRFMPLTISKPDKFNFFFEGAGEVTFNPELVDLWINMPLELTKTTLAVQRNAVATETTTMIRHYVGSHFSMSNNALIPRYLTSTASYEPGFLEPRTVMPGIAKENNYRFIRADGTDNRVDYTTSYATALGVLGRQSENTYSSALTISMSPTGTNFIRTNMQRVRNDVSDFISTIVE